MCRYSNKPGNHEYVWSFRNLKQEQVQIRFNLVVAIAIAQIVFLSGIDASEIRVSNDNTLFHPTYHFSCYLRLRSVACVKTSLRSNIHIKMFSPACSLSLKSNSFSFKKVSNTESLWIGGKMQPGNSLLIWQRYLARCMHSISCYNSFLRRPKHRHCSNKKKFKSIFEIYSIGSVRLRSGINPLFLSGGIWLDAIWRDLPLFDAC